MKAFYLSMAAKNFIPKVQQLEHLSIQIDEDGEKAMKLDSKKKYTDNNKGK